MTSPPFLKGGSQQMLELVNIAPVPAVATQAERPLSLSAKKNKSAASIGITFENLTYKIVQKDKTEKALIDAASGCVRPGRLTAIMGASGAGKTTFMNLLAGRIKANGTRRVTGSVRVNGQENKHVQRISGYVLQEDVLLPHLTPREHLEFAAKMQLPASASEAEVSDRVDKVLRSLRLMGCADTKVGNPLLKRGISGGERKRTSVGIELVADPQLLFLDEPTSGLDSDTAASLVDILHSLAEEGHTILATLHQPSSDMFRQFDDLVLLASGRIIYCGPANEAVDYFASLGHKCPPQMNPAEFLRTPLSVLCQLIDRLVTLLHNAQQATTNPEPGHVSVAQLAAARSNSGLDPAWEKSLPAIDMKVTDKISVAGQFGLLASRSWKMIIRDPQATFIKFAQYVFVTVFASLLFLRLDDNARGIQGKAGNVFTILLLFSFIPQQGVILLFPSERPVFLREYAKGLYHPFVYFVATNAAQLPFQIVYPVICAAINYWTVGLRGGFEHFVMYAVVAVVTYMIGAATGMLVGAALADVGRGMELGPSLIIPQMLVAGLFVPPRAMPVWLSWLRYISFVHWGWSANMTNEFLDRSVDCSSIAPNCSGNALLRFYSLEDTSYGLAIGLLIAFMCFYRLIGYVLLHVSAHRAKGNN